MYAKTLLVTEAQARLLQEVLQLPQLTVTFPKATSAGTLYDAIGAIVTEFDTEKEASAKDAAAQSSEPVMDPS